MSLFLPEGTKTASLQTPGVAEPANPEVTDDDIKLMQRVLTAASQYPNMIPDAFMAYVFDYIQSQRLEIPIGQVFGFARFAAQNAFVATGETRSSSAYGDLATVGPQITGLPSGKYLVIWGAAAAGSPGVSEARMKVVSGTAAATDNASVAATSFGSFGSVTMVDTITLPDDGNSLITKYASSDNTFACSWLARFLVAFRYSN